MDGESQPIAVERGIRLRPIGPGDLELLREWKNRNRERFFYQEEITLEQQEAWFAGFRTRPDDHMFVVEVEGRAVGCMGYRLVPGAVDVYNVIRGDSSRAPGIMHRALLRLVQFASGRNPGRAIIVRVITGNPAIRWYARCGFVEVERREDHVVMSWRPSAPVSA